MDKDVFVGVDLGSRMAKIVFLQNEQIIFSDVTDTGVNPQKTSIKLFENSLKELSLEKTKVSTVFSTGYGRNIVPFSDKKIAEISCHAKGVSYLFPNTRTVIDIGGQDSKIILIKESGKVIDFAMNDKCAAGTGRFLEVIANILEVTVDDLQELALKAKEEIDINSTCVVFAESEIIGLIAAGKQPAEIINSAHNSIAKRIRNMISTLHWQEPVVFTGGVAANNAMKTSIGKAMNTKIIVPENSFITGALGAALFAYESQS
jgi:(R)-2-hydroxyacyl-CoA dehydratese activating ATPase